MAASGREAELVRAAGELKAGPLCCEVFHCFGVDSSVLRVSQEVQEEKSDPDHSVRPARATSRSNH